MKVYAGLLLGLIGDTYRRLFWVSMRSRLYALAVSTSRISDDLYASCCPVKLAAHVACLVFYLFLERWNDD